MAPTLVPWMVPRTKLRMVLKMWPEVETKADTSMVPVPTLVPWMVPRAKLRMVLKI